MSDSLVWENIFSNKEWGKYPSETLIRFIARNFYNVKDRNKIKILELGLGTGANLWFCAREGFRVSGIEWSQTGVQRFKDRLENENLTHRIDEIKIGDYEQKLDEFEDESFDAVIDVASLCCNDFKKSQIVFKKAMRKLKVGGKFFSLTLAVGLEGFDESKGLEQTLQNGIYAHEGILRFSTLEKLEELYNNKHFKRTDLTIITRESDGKIIDKIYVIEGLKLHSCKVTGGGSRNFYMRNKVEVQNVFNCLNLSFSDDIYFNEDYARLYGEPFLFEYKNKKLYFKTIGIKNFIKGTSFYDMQSPYGYNGFFINTNDETFIKEALLSLRHKALEEKIIAFFIRFHPFDENVNFYAKNLDFFSNNKKIVVVDTRESIEKIRTNYNPRIKSCINKARKKLKIEFCEVDEALDFRFLYEKTMLRNNAKNFYFFDENYFKKLFKFKEYKVLKASFENEILSYASFFLHKDFSYYHLSANTLKCDANSALLDFFFEYASKQGSKFCILGGGVQDDDSLFNFKQKFSTLYTNFNIGGIIFDNENFKTICQNFNNSYFLKYRCN